MNGIKTIISKELARVFRDKKLVFSLFILPIVMVIGIFSLMGVLIQNMQKDIESHVPVAYIVNCPAGYMSLLEGNVQGADGENMPDKLNADIKYLKPSEYADEEQEIKDEILNGTVDILIVFPKDFDENELIAQKVNELPDINTFYNPSEDYSSQAQTVFVTSYLEAYRQMLLYSKYGSLDDVTLFTVDLNNDESVIQDDDKATGKMLGMMLPYFITMLIFASAMSLGVDMIAGEKERGTLASMLLSPINRTQIVLGKILSLAILSVLSATIYIVTMIIAMPTIFSKIGGEDVGISVRFTGGQIAELFLLLIAVVILYVSIIGTFAVIAKNVKEASTYITPAYLIVIVAGFMTMYGTTPVPTVRYAIPLYGSAMALKDILSREITTPNFIVALVSTWVCAIVLVAVMTKAFNSEKVMFNA